jgi:hypothetical protein
MKTYLIILFMLACPCLMQSQASENIVKLKQINIVKLISAISKVEKLLTKPSSLRTENFSPLKPQTLFRVFLQYQRTFRHDRQRKSWEQLERSDQLWVQ